MRTVIDEAVTPPYLPKSRADLANRQVPGKLGLSDPAAKFKRQDEAGNYL